LGDFDCLDSTTPAGAANTAHSRPNAQKKPCRSSRSQTIKLLIAVEAEKMFRAAVPQYQAVPDDIADKAQKQANALQAKLIKARRNKVAHAIANFAGYHIDTKHIWPETPTLEESKAMLDSLPVNLGIPVSAFVVSQIAKVLPHLSCNLLFTRIFQIFALPQADKMPTQIRPNGATTTTTPDKLSESASAATKVRATFTYRSWMPAARLSTFLTIELR
jgi:hypothetical protein